MSPHPVHVSLSTCPPSQVRFVRRSLARRPQVFKCIADLIRKIDTITYEELRAAIALLKLPEGHFLTQIYLPCAYAFHNLLDKLIDKELHYYLAPHHICLYWDAAADASESDRLPFLVILPRPANDHTFEPGAIQYKECPWDERYKPPHGTSFSTFFGPEYDKKPPLKFDEPSWIPAPLQRCWREGCKPDRILNHIRRFHEEMPTRVSEEHVKAYEDWLEKEDAEDYVYEAFQWPVPKCRPMTDPNRAAPVGRGVRPPADVAREAASNAAGETMPHSTTNSGDASACRAASAASVRANDRRDAARSALARDEGNNAIVVGKHYFCCFALDDDPDQLWFTLITALKVCFTPMPVSCGSSRCSYLLCRTRAVPRVPSRPVPRVPWSGPHRLHQPGRGDHGGQLHRLK